MIWLRILKLCVLISVYCIYSFYFLELPEEPTLKLSVEIVEHKTTPNGKPYLCQGQVGYPKGHLEIQLEQSDGNFTTILSQSNTNTDSAMVHGEWVENGTKCDTMQYVQFLLKGAVLPLSSNNSKLRCAAVASDQIPDQPILYTDETLKMISSKL